MTFYLLGRRRKQSVLLDAMRICLGSEDIRKESTATIPTLSQLHRVFQKLHVLKVGIPCNL